MRRRELATLFAGGGLFTEGGKQAGLTPIGALDNDTKKAEIYKLNHGNLIDVADIREVTEWQKYKNCWLLQASPPCKNTSRSKRHEDEKKKAEAAAFDLELASAVCRAVEAAKPQNFILENVVQYASSKAYINIVYRLETMGYVWRQYILNSADFGVPQSRDRVFLVASRILPELDLDLSPYRHPRIGWYAGIERHVRTCKEKTLAPYQVNAIQRAIESGKIAPNDVAVLVGGAGCNPNKPGVYHFASPSPTVRSCEGLRSGGWRPCIVKQADFSKPQGDAVGYKLSSRCLLALQGVPDSFVMGSEVVTGFVAGNGVSVPVARALCSALIQAENRR